MAKKTAPPTIINLARSHLSLCSASSLSPLILKFPPTAVRDLEIIDPAAVAGLVKGLVAANTLKPSPLIMVFSPDTYFEKNLTGIPTAEREAQVQAFIDAVPLTSTSSKIFRFQNIDRLVIINRHLYETFKSAFEALSFSIIAVVPGFVLGEAGAKGEFTGETCRLILKKQDFVLENSFISPDTDLTSLQQEQRFLKAHKAMFIMISIMLIVFTATMIFFILNNRRRPKAAVTATPVTLRPTLPPPTPTPASPSASLIDLKASVLNGSGITGLAARVEAVLNSQGLTDIETGNSPTRTAVTQVVFSPRVPGSTRQLLITELQQIFLNVTSRENPDSAFDIIITAGTIK